MVLDLVFNLLSSTPLNHTANDSNIDELLHRLHFYFFSITNSYLVLKMFFKFFICRTTFVNLALNHAFRICVVICKTHGWFSSFR
jgi:hypothetical protein